jgi:hypothetical protein
VGEKARIRAALGILGVTGALVIWSAIDKAWSMPPEAWGIATFAAGYFFSTGSSDNDNRRDRKKKNKSER